MQGLSRSSPADAGDLVSLVAHRQGLCQPQSPHSQCRAALRSAGLRKSRLNPRHRLSPHITWWTDSGPALACLNVTCAECCCKGRGGRLWQACRTESHLSSAPCSVPELLLCCRAASCWPCSAVTLSFLSVSQIMRGNTLRKAMPPLQAQGLSGCFLLGDVGPKASVFSCRFV